MGTVKFLHRQVGESGIHGDIYRGTYIQVFDHSKPTDGWIHTNCMV